MAFSTEIYKILVGDSSLNNLVDGIYYELLPANEDKKNTNIVFNYNRIENYSTISVKNFMTDWSLYVKVISPDTLKIDSITQRLNDYLLFVDDISSGIREIIFVEDTRAVDTEEMVYMNAIQYKVTVFN